MFNRLFGSRKKQEVFFDSEEGTEDVALLDVVIDHTEEKFEDAPEVKSAEMHHPKAFLADEIKECINILTNAKANASINEAKLHSVQRYGRLIYLTQTALSLGISGAAFATINYFSEQWDLPNKNRRISAHNQLPEKYIERNQTRANIERKFNNLANILQIRIENLYFDETNSIEERLAMILYYRMIRLDDWWTNSSDNYNFFSMGGKNYSCIENHKAQNWLPYDEGGYRGSCSTWSNYMNTYYISSLFPKFKGTDFCELVTSRSNPNPFEYCNVTAKYLCDWSSNSINSSLWLVENHTLGTEFHNALTSQNELSQLEFEINQLQAKAHATTPFFKNPYNYIHAAAGLALAGCLVGLAYKFKKAYNEYKEELAHVYDLDRCISDPKILNRLINLTARLNIPMKDATVDTLIAGLKNSLEEVVTRRRLRLGIGLFCAAQTEKLQRPDQGAWKDIIPLILEEAGYAAAQQAPKLAPSAKE